MAQLTVRNLDDDVKLRLKKRAARKGISVEEEVRQILRDSVKNEGRPKTALGSRIAARFARTGLTADLPELRGHGIRPADFGA